jgi:hypothetical protein
MRLPCSRASTITYSSHAHTCLQALPGRCGLHTSHLFGVAVRQSAPHLQLASAKWPTYLPAAAAAEAVGWAGGPPAPPSEPWLLLLERARKCLSWMGLVPSASFLRSLTPPVQKVGDVRKVQVGLAGYTTKGLRDSELPVASSQHFDHGTLSCIHVLALPPCACRTTTRALSMKMTVLGPFLTCCSVQPPVVELSITHTHHQVGDSLQAGHQHTAGRAKQVQLRGAGNILKANMGDFTWQACATAGTAVLQLRAPQ